MWCLTLKGKRWPGCSSEALGAVGVGKQASAGDGHPHSATELPAGCHQQSCHLVWRNQKDGPRLAPLRAPVESLRG